MFSFENTFYSLDEFLNSCLSNLIFSHLHNLLLFILTSTQLQKIYKERKNFDLRRLLAGSERLIDYLIDNLPLEPGFFLSAVPCLLMNAKTRSNIANAISQVCSYLVGVYPCLDV